MSSAAAVRLRFWGWSAAVVLLLVLFTFDVAPRLKFDTDILALLPPQGGDPALAGAMDQVADHIGRQTVFLVEGKDFDTARNAARRFAEVLRGSAAFAKVDLDVDGDWLQRSSAAYAPHRDGLLAPQDRALLQGGDAAALLAQARQALYTPAAFLRRSAPGEDPLDLFGDFLAAATPAAPGLELRDGLLVGIDAASAHPYVLLRVELAANAFSTGEEERAGGALDAAFAAAQAAGGTVNGSGVIQHAVAASRLARHEVSLFGGVQLVCVLGLLLAVFRSARVLLLSALALGLGVLAALTVCHYLFGRTHVLTLVFCSNLAGIAVDYSIYYCADQFRQPGRWRAADALPFIGPAISMSCLVALMSYALLGVAPFPGLRQMALFCCVGLATAYACVMAWYPRAIRPAPAAAALRLNGWFAHVQAWRQRLLASRLRLLLALVLPLAVVGLLRLKVEDDVRVLQPDPPQLAAQERIVHERLGNLVDEQFYLVRAPDAQALLQREEALGERLAQLQASGQLRGWSGVSRALPSAQLQTQDHSLLQGEVYQPGGPAERFMRELGFTAADIARRQDALAHGWTPLTPEQWLDSPAADPYRQQWLGPVGGDYASVVTLSGGEGNAAVAAAGQGLNGVQYIDRVADITEVLRRFRGIALWIVAASVLASALLLALPYGLRRGSQLMLTPLLGAVATPAALGLLGVHLTFFHVVALHLVLGLSTEYAILLQLPELQGASAMLSAALAAVLALISFGLLALSTTPFVHAIGLTVAIGVALGFAGAFLVGTIAGTHGAAQAPT